jgi:hypothetical protein
MLGTSFALVNDYIYENEQLIEMADTFSFIIGDSIIVEPAYNYQITYDEDKTTLIKYTLSDGTSTASTKTEYLIVNDQTLEETVYTYNEDDWTIYYQYTYEYENDQLIAWQLNEMYEDELVATQKSVITYEGDQLLSTLESISDSLGNWTESYKETIISTNSLIDTIYAYEKDENENWIYSFRVDYNYLSDIISSSVISTWNELTETWDISSEYNYSYDENEYLILESTTDEFFGSIETSYEYEEGNGNAATFSNSSTQLPYSLPTLKNASIDETSSKMNNNIRNQTNLLKSPLNNHPALLTQKFFGNQR